MIKWTLIFRDNTQLPIILTTHEDHKELIDRLAFQRAKISTPNDILYVDLDEVKVGWHHKGEFDMDGNLVVEAPGGSEICTE